MTRFSRSMTRLGRRLARSYEITLCALLVAFGTAVALPDAATDAGPEPAGRSAPPQCGNIQSSALVITR
jgi:hypothetical protein